jgi:hypothetical protein
VVDPTKTTLEAANEVTHETGTATGDEKVVGIKTVLGTTTTDEAGITTIFSELTTETTDDGTEFGKADH